MRHPRWEEKPLIDVLESLDHRRRPVRSSERKIGPYPYWGASGVVDHVDDYLFDEPTLLISEDGENLRTRKTPISFYVTGHYWVNNHAHVFKAQAGIDLRFMSYQMATRDVAGYLSGSTQPKLTAGAVHSMMLSVPSLSEQRRIAEVLGAIDDLIDTNSRLASELEHLARLMCLRASEHPIPLSDIAAVSATRMVKPVGQTAHYSLPAFDNEAQPYVLEGEEIRSGKLGLTEDVVLVSRLNPHIPRVWAVYLDEANLNVASTEFVPIRGLEASMEEIYALTSSAAYVGQLASRVTGTTGSHQRVDKAVLLDFRVPDVRELDGEVRRAIQEAVREAHSCRTMSKALRGTRDQLLPLLMSGAVRVRAS